MKIIYIVVSASLLVACATAPEVKTTAVDYASHGVYGDVSVADDKHYALSSQRCEEHAYSETLEVYEENYSGRATLLEVYKNYYGVNMMVLQMSHSREKARKIFEEMSYPEHIYQIEEMENNFFSCMQSQEGWTNHRTLLLNNETGEIVPQ